MTNWMKQSLRLLQHEFRRGELTIICLAIVLAVATVFSLSGFSQHIKSALINNSTSFIAADRVLRSSRPVATSILAQGRARDLQSAEQIEMSSMVFSGEKMQLVEIKAVSSTYPLRGELLIADKVDGPATPMHAPANGKIWVEKKLLSALELAIGDSIDIGVKHFTIDGVVTQIPDASFSVFTSGPQVIVNILDIDKTELIQPGSRLTYKYLFAGEAAQLEAFDDWIKPQINETQRWYDIQSRQSPLANALNRAEKYLALASMLGIVLAAVAVAVASRRYSHRHQPTVAVFKAMGAAQGHVKKLYLLHWSLLCVFSLVIGLLAGYGLLSVGLHNMQDYLPIQSDSRLSWYPFTVSVLTGVICAVAFAIAPLKALITTSPLAVIRGFSESIDVKSKYHLHLLLPLSALFALLLLFSRNVALSLSLLLGGILVSALLLLLGRVLMNAGKKVGSQAGKSWHLAMANLKRRANENSVQLVSFTIAIKLLLVILVMRNALIDEWQQQLPDNAPNRFLVNIAQQEVENVGQFIEQHNLTASGLYPVVRGRLASINEDVIAKSASKEETDGSDNGRQGVGRELNMTWRTELPANNVITQGQWWQQDSNVAQVSVEQTLAKRLDIKLGDMLAFQIGSTEVVVSVTSIREVDWQSMQPNFYMVFNAQVLQDFPATYISSVFLPENKQGQFQQFLSQYPTISIIDVDAMINQLRTVIEQVSIAVEFILILVVLAGSLVLVAQVQASMEERERELAILRTLGAKGSLLRNSVLFEFISLGAIAGIMASLAMELGVYVLQSQVFNMSASLHPSYWLLGIFSGAAFVGVVGLVSCWRLLNMSSVTLIRRTM
ncbi:ABC transporter permease [Colwelliaceae bacterium 6471]